MEWSPREEGSVFIPSSCSVCNSQSGPHDSVAAVVRNRVTHEHAHPRTDTQKNVTTVIDSIPTLHALACVSIRRPCNIEQDRWRSLSPVCLCCLLVGQHCTASQQSSNTAAVSQCRVCIIPSVHSWFLKGYFDGGSPQRAHPDPPFPVTKWDSQAFTVFPGCFTAVVLTSLQKKLWSFTDSDLVATLLYSLYSLLIENPFCDITGGSSEAQG